MQRSWPGRETILGVRRTVVEVGAEREVGVRYSREVKGRRLLEVREEKRLPNATAFPPAEHAIHQCAPDAPANAAAADGPAPLQAPASLRRAVVPAPPNHLRHRDIDWLHARFHGRVLEPSSEQPSKLGRLFCVERQKVFTYPHYGVQDLNELPTGTPVRFTIYENRAGGECAGFIEQCHKEDLKEVEEKLLEGEVEGIGGGCLMKPSTVVVEGRLSGLKANDNAFEFQGHDELEP